MFRADDIEAIRCMTPEERFEEWRILVQFAWRFFDVPDAETGRRKWAAWQRQHDEGNRRVLEALRRLEP